MNGSAGTVALEFRQKQQQTNQSHKFDNLFENQQFQQYFANGVHVEIKFEFIQTEPVVSWSTVGRCR